MSIATGYAAYILIAATITELRKTGALDVAKVSTSADSILRLLSHGMNAETEDEIMTYIRNVVSV